MRGFRPTADDAKRRLNGRPGVRANGAVYRSVCHSGAWGRKPPTSSAGMCFPAGKYIPAPCLPPPPQNAIRDMGGRQSALAIEFSSRFLRINRRWHDLFGHICANRYVGRKKSNQVLVLFVLLNPRLGN
jgi:hypothetical protein